MEFADDLEALGRVNPDGDAPDPLVVVLFHEPVSDLSGHGDGSEVVGDLDRQQQGRVLFHESGAPRTGARHDLGLRVDGGGDPRLVLVDEPDLEPQEEVSETRRVRSGMAPAEK